MKLVREREMVEDVLNETMMEVWRQAARFEGPVVGEHLGILDRASPAVSRLRKKRETSLDEEQAATIEDEAPTPDERAISGDMSRLIGQLMEKLSFEHREILHLAYYQSFRSRRSRMRWTCPPTGEDADVLCAAASESAAREVRVEGMVA